jgi:hypothetical protein
MSSKRKINHDLENKTPKILKSEVDFDIHVDIELLALLKDLETITISKESVNLFLKNTHPILIKMKLINDYYFITGHNYDLYINMRMQHIIKKRLINMSKYMYYSYNFDCKSEQFKNNLCDCILCFAKRNCNEFNVDNIDLYIPIEVCRQGCTCEDCKFVILHISVYEKMIYKLRYYINNFIPMISQNRFIDSILN